MAREPYAFRIAVLMVLACGWALSAGSARADEPTWLDDGGGQGYYAPVVLRFGWWATKVSGSPNKTLEFQGDSPSPFWDADTLLSDGQRTMDFHATGTDNETSQAGLRYYGPAMSANVDYDRFLHRLDRNNLDAFNPAIQPGPYFNAPNPPTAQTPGNPLTRQRDQQDIGQDYAIRVQEFNARLKGDITDGVKWRVNVWNQQKQGDRQAVALGHCYSGPNPQPLPNGTPATQSTCHMVSKRQTINWTTTEVEPAFEFNLGAVTVEYSRPMRTFGTADSIVTRNYNTNNHEGWIWPGAGQVPYNVVPENTTQIDKLKIGADLSDDTRFYAYLMTGQTLNEELGNHRFFNNFDLRLTNESIDGLTLSGYGKQYRQSGQIPTVAPEAGIIQGPGGVPPGVQDYTNPINYVRTTAGLNSRWKPYDSGWVAPEGLSFVTGYELGVLDRENANTEFESPGVGEFEQLSTVSNTIVFTTDMRWSPAFDTYVRYRLRYTQNPLYGLRLTTTDVNTALPTNENLIELGSTWTPTDNFMLSGTLGIEKRYHLSEHENTNSFYGLLVDQNNIPLLGRPLPNPRTTAFAENNFPITLSSWWAPSQKLSFNGGYANLGAWISQLITLGDQYNDGVYATNQRNYVEADAYQSRWKHQAQSQVVDLGANYCWTDRLTLNGGLQYVWGSDITLVSAPDLSYNPLKNNAANGGGYAFTVPDWSYITPGSDVINESWRITTGFDYQFTERVGTYFRYNYYSFTDFGNNAGNGNGGTGDAHLFLGGMSAVF